MSTQRFGQQGFCNFVSIVGNSPRLLVFGRPPSRTGFRAPDATDRYGFGGNPALEPYRANAYDLSIEKYFGEASYVALAAFYKDMDSYIYTRQIPWDFSGYDYEGDQPPASDIGVFSTPCSQMLPAAVN